MRHAHLLAALAPVLLVACGSGEEDEEFAFDASDVRAAIVGDWTGSVTFEGQPAVTYDMTLAQAPPSVEPTCGDRPLTSVQCISTSTMNLEGTITTADGALDATPLTGAFVVMGYELTSADLSLTGAGTLFSAFYDHGAFQEGTVQGPENGTFDLRRK